MRISDWSSDVCSSDLRAHGRQRLHRSGAACRPIEQPHEAFFMPYEKASEIEQAAGPRLTTNNTGRMKRIRGKDMMAGRRADFSSARIMRTLRTSADRTTRAEPNRVPYF